MSRNNETSELNAAIVKLKQVNPQFKNTTEKVKLQAFGALKTMVNTNPALLMEHRLRLADLVYQVGRKGKYHQTPFITALSLMVLGYTANDVKLGKLLQQPSVLKHLISCFTTSRVLCVGTVPKLDLLKFLSLITTIDETGFLLARSHHLLDCVMDIAEQDSHQYETQAALNLLAAFALTKDYAELMDQNQRFASLVEERFQFAWREREQRNIINLEALSKRTDKRNKKVRSKELVVLPKLQTPQQDPVVISYSKNDKKIANEINRKLRSKLFNVVMGDGPGKVEEISGAIRKARRVLILISESYYRDIDCKLEALYAHKCRNNLIPVLVERGYTTTGWLGELLPLRELLHFRIFSAEEARNESAEMQKLTGALYANRPPTRRVAPSAKGSLTHMGHLPHLGHLNPLVSTTHQGPSPRLGSSRLGSSFNLGSSPTKGNRGRDSPFPQPHKVLPEIRVCSPSQDTRGNTPIDPRGSGDTFVATPVGDRRRVKLPLISGSNGVPSDNDMI